MGRDGLGRPLCGTLSSFNPRARVGRDACASYPRIYAQSFNPRARVGRDKLATLTAPIIAGFQSTRPRGARPMSRAVTSTGARFQSTRPRGARPSPSLYRIRRWSFNPRARVGRDRATPSRPHLRLQFQSTRPRGARQYLSRSRNKPSLFQSTRPRGARLNVIFDDFAAQSVSIHAPAWGATSSKRSNQPCRRVSIHAPAWGATIELFSFLWAGYRFQSTRPRGARHQNRSLPLVSW